MKKRLLSLILVLAMLAPSLPVTAKAVDVPSDFPTTVTYELPHVTKGKFIDGGEDELPKLTGTDFIGELSGAMPKIRSDGFLAEPTAPLKEMPASGSLIETEFDAPAEGAIAIGTAAELAAMQANKSYYLTADIDLTGIAWTPIPYSKITLDGQGHVISGLTPTLTSSCAGLFGEVSSSLTVRNLILKDFSFTASDLTKTAYVGALVGACESVLTIENCVAENIQITTDGSNSSCIGGLVGRTEGSRVTMRDCAVTGLIGKTDVLAETYRGCNAGGLLGYSTASNLEMTDCFADVDIDVASTTGGLVSYTSGTTNTYLRCAAFGTLIGGESSKCAGFAESSYGTTTATDCVFDGSLKNARAGLFGQGYNMTLTNCRMESDKIEVSVPDSNTNIGGLVGSVSGTLSASYCLSNADIIVYAPATGTRTHRVGGILGFGEAKVMMSDCLSVGEIAIDGETTNSFYCGGIIGSASAEGSSFQRCENRGDVEGTAVGGLFGYNLNKHIFFTDCRNSGDITNISTSKNNYIVTGGIAGYANGTLENCLNTGVLTGPVVGGMIGRGYGGSCKLAFQNCRTVSTMQGVNCCAGGILGDVYSVSKDISFDHCAVDIIVSSSYASIGGLAKMGMGTAENCIVRVQTDEAVNLIGGAFAELAAPVSIRNCYAYLAAENVGAAGGLLAAASYSATLTNCAAEISVEDTDANADTIGGLVGKGMATLLKCYAIGKITVDDNSSYLGGLMGSASTAVIGQCWADVDLTNGYSIGGLVGAGNTQNKTITLYGSWADGILDAPDSTGSIGGLIGSADTLSMQDCCFTGEISPTDAECLGGLVGKVDGFYHGPIHCIMKNCYTEIDLEGRRYIGGIIGNADSAAIRDCRYEGSLNSNSGGDYVGGIAGSCDGEIENCRTVGTLKANTKGGGILGIGTVNMTSCISEMQISHSDLSTTPDIGGIAGNSSGTFIDCHVTRPVEIVRSEILFNDYATANFGGLIGSGDGTLLNCSSRGVTVRVLTSSGTPLCVGGLIGSGSGTLKNCRVDGAVALRGEYVEKVSYIGGLIGYMPAATAAGSCIMNGPVSGYIMVKPTDRKFHIGAFGGSAKVSLRVDQPVFYNTVSFAEKQAVHETELLGSGLLLYDEVDIELPEKKIENYQVKVMNFDPATGVTTLLKGAEVKIDGHSLGFTDEFGLVGFDSGDFSSTSLITVSADLEGYFHGEIVTYLADDGLITIALTRKVPGEIYIKSAYHIQHSTFTEVLSGHNKIRIPYFSEELSEIMVGVDWNDIDEEGRYICLVGENGKSVIYLDETGYGLANFTNLFEPGEEIMIVAGGTYNGEIIQESAKLHVQVQEIDVSIPTPTGKQELGGSKIPGDPDSKKLLYFLNGVDIELKLDDLAKYASEITFENGVLTLKYLRNDAKEQKISLFTKRTDKVQFGGKISIPLTDLYEGEWSGGIIASVNNSTESEKTLKKILDSDKSVPEKLKVTYNFAVGAVPCYADVSVGVGGSAELKIAGTVNDPHIAGEFTVEGEGMVSGGVGTDVSPDIEVKLGLYGDVKVKIPMTYTFLGEYALDPTVQGGIGGRLSVKAFELVELEGKLRLGGFDYDKNGVTWSLLWKKYDADGDLIVDSNGGGSMGGRALMASDDSEEWSMISRDYLANGGGFLLQNADLMSFSGSAGSALRYENIAPISESAMTVENGQPVLYFTADDGISVGGGAADHTVLYRTAMQADGSWSTPVALTSAEDGYPALPVAENGFAAWVNSDETATLDQMLTSTDIKVWDGTTVTTFAGNGYVSHPKLSVSTDGSEAMLCWFSDPLVSSENLAGGDNILYYATYTNGAWSKASKISTKSAPVLAVPECVGRTSDTVYYLTADGDLYNKSNSLIASGVTGRTALRDKISVSINELDQLFVRNNGTMCLLEDIQCSAETPVIAYDGENQMYYVFWSGEDGIWYVCGSGNEWSKPLLLTATDRTAEGIRATVRNGVPVVSYYLTKPTANGLRTDLFTVSLDPDAADLVLCSLESIQDDTVPAGCISVRAKILNNGLHDVDDILITVTDEDGKTVLSQSADCAVASGADITIFPVFAADNKPHTYTVRVQPIIGGSTAADGDPSDNALSFESGKPSAAIADTAFLSENGKDIRLQALVRNTGSVDLNDLTVEIGTAAGEVLLTKSFSGENNMVPAGSCRQIVLESIAPNVFYTVTARTGDTVLDTAMLIYEDPNAEVLAVQKLQISKDGKAELTLAGQNQAAGGAELILALYQNDRMVASGTKTVSTLNGSQKLRVTLSGNPSGSCAYKLFLLSEDGALSPLRTPLVGTTRIED